MNGQLKIVGAGKSFGRREVFSDISFECQSGEIVGIFGRNGTGKSTLLKMIFGTMKADTMQLFHDDIEISAKDVIPKKLIGYLPQQSFLPKDVRVRDIIPFFYPTGEIQDKIFYSPNVVTFESGKIGSLSLGQLRYLELLLIANLQHPFLLLDEPFSMIEPLYKDSIKHILLDVKSTKGIILTDHYYDDVLQITDRNFLMKDSRMFEINGKDELQANDYL